MFIRLFFPAVVLTISSVLMTPVPAHAVVVQGTDVGVPAYVDPGDTMFTNLANASPAASLVIMNTDNGSGGHVSFNSTWQAQADTLRAKTDTNGHHTKVLGYVDTVYTTTSLATAKAWVDDYMNSGHVDGIFFDEVTDTCGTNNVNRNYYRTLRTYVLSKLSTAFVADNPGDVIDNCYLDPTNRTADTFVTFEGAYSDYMAKGYYWDNVKNGPGPGHTDITYSKSSFWHMVYNVANLSQMQNVFSYADVNYGGYAYATSDTLPNPWDTTPSVGFSAETQYAAASWQP